MAHFGQQHPLRPFYDSHSLTLFLPLHRLLPPSPRPRSCLFFIPWCLRPGLKRLVSYLAVRLKHGGSVLFNVLQQLSIEIHCDLTSRVRCGASKKYERICNSVLKEHAFVHLVPQAQTDFTALQHQLIHEAHLLRSVSVSRARIQQFTLTITNLTDAVALQIWPL